MKISKIFSPLFTCGAIFSLVLFSLSLKHQNESFALPLQSMHMEEDKGMVYSEWVKVPKQVVAFALSFEQDQNMQVQSELRGGTYIDWEALPMDHDLESQDTKIYSKIFITSGTKKVRFRFLTPEIPLGELTWITKEVNSQNSEVRELGKYIQDLFFQKADAREDLNIVSRKEARLDESFRYIDPDSPPPLARQIVNLDPEFIKKFADELSLLRTVSTEDEKKMLWPYEYMKGANKIFIHHSAGRMPDCSKDEGIEVFRSIYRYHAVSRGWGDIGYHYVIDPCDGTIYEGRAGGDGVKGAHVGAYNTGSIGIMLMGNYSEEKPSELAIETLGKLVAYVGEKYDIDPMGEGMFRGENFPNVMGHRDVNVTGCPGENLYVRLDDIRSIAKRYFQKPIDYYGKDSESITDKQPDVSEFQRNQYDAYPFSANINDLFLPAGESISVNIAFKNIGRNVWNDKTYLRIDGNVSGLQFAEGKTQSNVARIVEKSVASGGLATFELFIQVPEDATYHQYTFELLPVMNGKVASEHSMEYRVLVRGKPGFRESSEQGTVNSEAGADESSDVTAPMSSGIFEDVPSSHEFASYIRELLDDGIISRNNFFEPKRPVRRDEFAKLVSRAADLRMGTESFTYLDVSANNEFRNYIELLRSNNITSAKEQFSPTDMITRGEAIKVIVNAFALSGSDEWNFQDVVGKVFEPYVKIATAHNLVSKRDLFYPNNLLTRDQAAKMISLARNRSGKNVLGVQDPNPSLQQASQTTDYSPQTFGSLGPTMRVAVGFSSPEIEIKDYNTAYNVYSGEELLFQNVRRKTAVVSYQNNSYEVRVGGDERFVSEPVRLVAIDRDKGALQVTNWTRPANEYDGKQDTAFRDTLEIVKDTGSENLIVVNELPLEKYLWGLAEQPNDMPAAKNETIAVAARSYALYYIEHGPKEEGKPYYLNSSPNDQVYRGYLYELRIPRFVDAVLKTQGEAVTYRDGVVKVPFFSQSGGYTITPGMEDNTWKPESFRFTQSVEDPWSCGGTFENINKKLRCPEKIRGHRVGVSAKGAEMQAIEGKSYKEILGYYLKDIEVKKVY